MNIVRLPYCYQCGVPHVPDDVAARVRAGEKITVQIISGSGVAANVLRWGTGAISVDGCRVGTTKDVPASVSQQKPNASVYGRYGIETGLEDGHNPNIGRWPANVLLDEDAAALLDASTEPSQSRIGKPRTSVVPGNGYGMTHTGAEYDDAGGPSRFFYVAKASREERNRGLDAVSERPMLWSAGTQNPGSFQSPNTNRASRNHHPTVKPIELMQYLCRLVTPPGGTVLDPFAGSGSTLIAALREGFEAVGIEREAEYVELSRLRAIGDAPLLNQVEVVVMAGRGGTDEPRDPEHVSELAEDPWDAAMRELAAWKAESWVKGDEDGAE